MTSRGKSLADAAIAILAFMAVGPVVSILVSKTKIANDRFFFDEPLPLLAFLLVPVGLLVVVGILLRRRGESWSDIGFAWPESRSHALVLTVALIVADLFVIFVVGPTVYRMTGTEHDLASFEPLVGNPTGLIGAVIFGWVMGGVAEEVLFRGYLMRNFANGLGGATAAWWVAAGTSSILFSLPHLYQGVGGAIQTGLLGFVSAAFFILGRRSLVPLILAHGLVNTISFVSIYLGWGWA